MSTVEDPAKNDQTQESEHSSRLNYFSLIVFFVSIAAVMAIWIAGGTSPGFAVISALFAAVAISVVIAQSCDPFAEAAQWIGVRFRLPGSVRGATLDAVASSMPELFAGIFFVVVALSGSKTQAERLVDSAEGYGSTIATCAGSSIYNMILIPAVCAIAISFSRLGKPVITVQREVIYRDGVWAVGAQFGLLVFLFLPRLHWPMAVFAIIAYVVYIFQLYRDAIKFQESTKEVEELSERSSSFLFGFFEVKLNMLTAILVLLTSTVVAATACYFLVKLTNQTAMLLRVPPFFIAVILTAAVSSVPDTLMSLGAAKRGDDSGAISNAFGSNIFDICIGMSIPLLVYCYLNDWQPVSLVDENQATMRGVTGLRILLFVLTIITMSMIAYQRVVTRTMGLILCFLYCIFIGYAVLGSLGIVNV